jgi:histidine triad (HIT) family protein
VPTPLPDALPSDPQCIFCRIVRGEIPARVVHETDVVLAFDDVSPQAPVHTLIIPKGHYAHLGDAMPREAMAAVFSAVPTVAALKGVSDSGYRVIVNNGPDANQTVGHVHVHILGGRPMTHGMVCFAEDA